MISSHATNNLLQLDYSLNKPFKDNIKTKYVEYLIKSGWNIKTMSDDII